MKRIFVQWFPVDNAGSYNVYCTAGKDLTTANYSKKFSVPASSYYFESEKLPGDNCWSVGITTVSKDGLYESSLSKVYSTCKI
jgi:fibronectin type 3 domain-containing protein